jgi:predicted nucleotidyltransferase
MQCQEVLDRLASHRPELTELGVKSLALFGSVARNQASPDSDVDLLVTFDRPVGLFHFARVRRRLAEILGSPVDLVTEDALRAEMREQILRHLVRAA